MGEVQTGSEPGRWIVRVVGKNGAPGGTRTPDQQIRRYLYSILSFCPIVSDSLRCWKKPLSSLSRFCCALSSSLLSGSQKVHNLRGFLVETSQSFNACRKVVKVDVACIAEESWKSQIVMLCASGKTLISRITSALSRSFCVAGSKKHMGDL